MTGFILMLILVGLFLLVIAAAPAMAAPFIPGPPDAELELTASVTKTSSADSSWLDLGKGYAPGGIGQAVAGVVDISAISADNGQTYAFGLEGCSDDGDGDPDTGSIVVIGVAVPATATGIVVCKGFITCRFVRLSLVIAGTGSPSITYTGQLNPS